MCNSQVEGKKVARKVVAGGMGVRNYKKDFLHKEGGGLEVVTDRMKLRKI